MTINGVSTCTEAGTEKYERFQSKISPSLIGERTHITLAVRRQGYHTLVCILDTDIRNFECGKWFKTPDGFRNITLRLVAHFLPDDLSFVGHTEQHRATFAVKESAERFHAALQLPGGFLELHLPVFLFGYQLFYYIEVVYVHIQFVTIVQR